MTETQKCSECKNTLDLTLFSRNSRNPSGRQRICKECQRDYATYADPEQARVVNRERSAAWNLAHPERVKELRARYRIRKKYGITIEEYQRILAGNCGICDRKPPRPVLDHCHQSGIVRGVLCDTCNTGIGMFGDDPLMLQRAIDYLRGTASS